MCFDTAMPASKMTPVAPRTRIETVDILRGISILGIFFFNMLIYAGNLHVPLDQMTPANRAVILLVRFVAQAKFYPLFSFLFGWGMAVQMARAEERETPFVPHYVRRMTALLLIGLIHALLIWDGDILVTYALLGLPLLLFRKASDRTLLVTAGVCILIPVLLSTPGPAAAFLERYAALQEPLHQTMMEGYYANVFVEGSYLEATAHRWHALVYSYTNVIFWGTHIFGMFLLGLLVGRRQIFQNITAHLPLFRQVMWGGLIVGLPLNVLFVAVTQSPGLVPDAYVELATRGARTVAGSALSLCYAAAIVLLAEKPRWRQRLAPLAHVGRMGLSNYLAQSIVCTLIFYGYGLGLYSRVGAALAFVLLLTIYQIQIGVSKWWLNRFRFGPAEWLWRSLTYGQPQTMKVPSESVSLPASGEDVPQRAPTSDWLLFLGGRLAFIALVAFAIVYFCFLGLDLASNSTAPVSRAISVWDRAGPAFDETIEFFQNAVRGDLGYIVEGVTQHQSIPVTEVVANTVIQSGSLLAIAIGFAALIGVAAGGLAATRRYSPVSLSTLTLTIVGVSIPSFFLALLFQVADIKFYQRTGLGLFPVFGLSGPQRTTALLPQVVAPGLVLAARPLAHITRVTFVNISEVLNRDFIRTAQAKGLGPNAVYWRHTLRNAGVSILTAIVVSLRFALGSLPVVEIFFSWPGLGVRMLNGIYERNATMVAALALTLGVAFLLITLLADAAYRLIDPRLRTTTNGGES
jgi:uncharacterized protein